MDFSSFVTPTSIVALFIVVVTLLLRLFMDARDIQADAKIAQNLRNLGRKHAQQKVTVVVELGKRADSITPLLDHLFSSPYKKLEVIVLIKHTAGKNAKRQLELYRQHRQIKTSVLYLHAQVFQSKTLCVGTQQENLLQLSPPTNDCQRTFIQIYLSTLYFHSLTSSCLVDPYDYHAQLLALYNPKL
jgi:hypothetical protein